MAKAKKPAENPNQNCLEGMSCPLCGDFGPFKIFVTQSGMTEVSDDGTDFINGDTEWGEDSDCECIACGYSAKVRQFSGEPESAKPVFNEKKLTVQSSYISSSQEWAKDPGMIEVYVSHAFLEKAEKCVAFMQENDVHKVTIWWAFGYTLYLEVEALDEDDLKGKEIVTDENGDEFVEFEPEYCIDGCHAEVYKDGRINAVFPFKHTSEHLWCAVGTLTDLKAKLAATPIAA